MVVLAQGIVSQVVSAFGIAGDVYVLVMSFFLVMLHTQETIAKVGYAAFHCRYCNVVVKECFFLKGLSTLFALNI